MKTTQKGHPEDMQKDKGYHIIVGIVGLIITADVHSAKIVIKSFCSS